MSEPKVIQLGKNTRRSYSKIDEVLEMPNLIEVQKNSYKWFLEEGLREVFRDVSPITNFAENLILEFTDYTLDESAAKYSFSSPGNTGLSFLSTSSVTVTLSALRSSVAC